MSTLTRLTPLSLLMSPSMACWQCSQEMSGALRIISAIVVYFLFYLGQVVFWATLPAALVVLHNPYPPGEGCVEEYNTPYGGGQGCENKLSLGVHVPEKL